MWTTLVLAALAAPPWPLTFDDVLTRAEAHPRLAGRDEALEVRRAGDAEISRLSGNPSLQVLPGWRLPGAADPGFEIQVTLSQTFDVAGIGAERRAAAAAERAHLGAARRAEALSARLDAAQAWLHLWAVHTERAQVEAELALARELVETLQRTVTAGEALESDALEATLFAETLARAVIDLEGHGYDAAMQLAAALGLDGADRPAPDGALPQVRLPPESEWRRWIARAEALPQAAAARVAARAAHARAVEAEAQDTLRVTPTVTVQLERPEDVLLWGGVGLQPAWFADSARARSQARAVETTERVDARIAAVDAARALRFALHEVAHTREVEAQLEARILPAAERWVAGVTRRFEAGEAPVFGVLRAQRRLAEVRADRVEVRAARAWAEVKAWLLLASLPAEDPKS